ncbi:hypothetical protein LTR67_004641 [Exophiala xenobiotica]
MLRHLSFCLQPQANTVSISALPTNIDSGITSYMRRSGIPSMRAESLSYLLEGPTQKTKMHTITSFTKARSGYGGITDALLEFDRYKVWEETGEWINEGMLKAMADNFLIPEIFRKGATFDKNRASTVFGKRNVLKH